MRLPIGMKHVARTTVAGQTTFSCKYCGFTAQVDFVAAGAGIAESPLFIGMGASRQRAAADADKAASREADLNVRLAACPHCGRREDSAVRRVGLESLIPGVAIGIVSAIPGAFITLVAGLHPLVGLIGGGLLGGSGAWYVYRRRRFRLADSEVVFRGQDVASEQG
ncbi:MAG: hypothetical protein V2A73_16825 [Pseudomonadota bacterium]